MLGQELMRVLYKKYKIPKANGRYIDMGMSFKKNDPEEKKHCVKTKRQRLKPGMLMEIVYNAATHKWESARDLSTRVNAAVESIRNSLIKLHNAGRLECNNIPGMLQFRKPK